MVLNFELVIYLREQKGDQKSNKRTLSGCLTTSYKTNASDAWFILIRDAWTYSAMEFIGVSPRHAENLSDHITGKSQYLAQDAHRVACGVWYIRDAWHGFKTET